MSDPHATQKVEEWLAKQQVASSPGSEQLNLVTRWKLDSLSELSGCNVLALIAIAESGTIAVTASSSGENSPDLLLFLNPDPDTIPITLSSNPIWNPLLLQLQGHEFVVAHVSDGNVHLWDTKSFISKIMWKKYQTIVSICDKRQLQWPVLGFYLQKMESITSIYYRSVWNIGNALEHLVFPLEPVVQGSYLTFATRKQ